MVYVGEIYSLIFNLSYIFINKRMLPASIPFISPNLRKFLLQNISNSKWHCTIQPHITIWAYNNTCI